jgi:hypothetical protein
MSQTLAQRRALASLARERPVDVAPAPAAAPSSVPADRPGCAPDDADRFRPSSGAAVRAIATLVRGGARVIDVGRLRVLLSRAGRRCEVDRAGHVRWGP